MSLPALAMPRPRAAALGPVLIAGTIGLAYVLLNIRSADLAAHEFRADLFGREGFTIWNGNWYGGHHTVGYSVLFPPLGWLLGPKVVGALALAAAAGAFALLVERHFGAPARWGALWFGVGAASMLFDGRLPFALGVALGLWALLALQRGRYAIAALLALATALASPVAGAFVALACTAVALAHRRDPSGRPAALVAAAALAPPALFALLFPEGGRQPFELEQLLMIQGAVVGALLLLPASERALRAGAALYGLAALATFAVPTPMGSNVVRLAPLVGAGLLACVIAQRRLGGLRLVTAVAALGALAWWQCQPAVARILHAGGGKDPAGEAAYYEPLLAQLEGAGGPPGRLEIPFTNTKRETSAVAGEVPLARGWERQLDVGRNPIFYDGTLDQASYERWLHENGVRWVALPSAAPDYSARAEAALVRAGLPYLRERWGNEHWRLYEVVPRPPMAVPEGSARIDLVRLGSDDAALRVRRPGSALLRLHWSPYWLLEGGCVEQAPGGWTRVSARREGVLELRTDFSPARAIEHGRRCD
jgi:hypothetical protein